MVSWSQPSGLSLAADAHALYVADSESSSLRKMSASSGGATLLAGGDAAHPDNLFVFGDRCLDPQPHHTSQQCLDPLDRQGLDEALLALRSRPAKRERKICR